MNEAGQGYVRATPRSEASLNHANANAGATYSCTWPQSSETALYTYIQLAALTHAALAVSVLDAPDISCNRNVVH